MPQVVSDTELPSAVILGGLQFNLAGIIGPALGGLLVPFAGANFVFALNGACFLLVVLAAWQWKQPTGPAKLPERFFESFGTVVHYVRCAPGLQVVLARTFLFALFISAIPALIPVVGLKVLQLSSSNLGAFVHQHGSWVGSRSGFHLSVASGAFLARFPHAVGEFADCHRLRVDGTRSPDRSILHCRGASRRGMDIVCFRTLGGGAARDAKLGAGPHERCGDNDIAGSDSSWGSDLGFSCRYSRSNLCLVRVGDSVPAKSLLAGRLSINFTHEIPITYRPLERGASFRSE